MNELFCVVSVAFYYSTTRRNYTDRRNNRNKCVKSCSNRTYRESPCLQRSQLCCKFYIL